MTTSPTTDDLRRMAAELKAKREAATDGEWSVERQWSQNRTTSECEIVPRIVCPKSPHRECGRIADLVGAPYLGYESTLPNSYFITHAANIANPLCTAALQLADELEAARAEIERLKKWSKENSPPAALDVGVGDETRNFDLKGE